jgi:hypothetical protein
VRSGRTFGLKLVRSCSVVTYVKLKDNENQVYFLWQKIAVDDGPVCHTVTAADVSTDSVEVSPAATSHE